ncbi:MAG: redoxin domain-containing protein [Peptococcaceae bacterium]|nr:redoxin domain-containing protein [Peptococcaceae bacterium]
MARDAHSSIQASGFQVAAISADSLKSHIRFSEKLGLPFPLLTDADKAVCKLYAVRMPILGIRRTVFAISQDGTILHRQNGAPAPTLIIKNLNL